MYNDFKIYNYNNTLVSTDMAARHLAHMTTGDVIDGLTVTADSPLSMYSVLTPGNAMIRYGSGMTATAALITLINNFKIQHDTADPSNPRIDLIVVYVDTSLTGSSATNDNPGVTKATFVKGTPSASPAAPNAAAIQSKVGASNPYIIVGSVKVRAGATSILSTDITDVRTMALDTSIKAIGYYSASEVATPYRWIDSKTIYKKTVSTGSLNGVTTKSVAHGISGLTWVTDLEAMGKSSTSVFYPVPLVSSSSGNSIAGISVTSTNVVFGMTTTSTDITDSYVTLWYTK